MTNEQRITQLEQRVTELERQLSEKEAAAATTASFKPIVLNVKGLDFSQIGKEFRQRFQGDIGDTYPKSPY